MTAHSEQLHGIQTTQCGCHLAPAGSRWLVHAHVLLESMATAQRLPVTLSSCVLQQGASGAPQAAIIDSTNLGCACRETTLGKKEGRACGKNTPFALPTQPDGKDMKKRAFCFCKLCATWDQWGRASQGAII